MSLDDVEDVSRLVRHQRLVSRLRTIVHRIEGRGVLERGRLVDDLTVREIHSLWSATRAIAASDLPMVRLLYLGPRASRSKRREARR